MCIRDSTLAVRNPNALLTVVSEGEEHMVLPKDIQRHPLKQTVEHLDLIEVRRGEKVVVDVTVHVEGEVAQGAAFNLEEATVPVEAEATHLPEFVTIDIEGREIGQHVHASDVQLPAGTTLQLEDDYIIATVSEPVVQDLGEEPEAEGETAEGASTGAAEGDSAEGDTEDSDN